MKVVLADIDTERTAALHAEVVRSGAKAEAVTTDVADPDAMEALAERAYERFGTVDMLVNNAGIMAFGFSWEIPAQRWDAMLRVNIGGYVNGIRAFVPRMLAAGTPAWVVNVSSVGGLLPSPMMAPYSVTKFGVLALAESLHYEMQMKQAPIRVSVVTPGHVKSDIFRAARPGDDTPPEVQQFGQWLQNDADERGLTPDEHAERVFTQIAESRYWVVPQPEALDPALQPRTDMILGRATPALQMGG